MVNSCPGKNVEVSLDLLNLLTCSNIPDGILFLLLLLNTKDPRLYPCRPRLYPCRPRLYPCRPQLFIFILNNVIIVLFDFKW